MPFLFNASFLRQLSFGCYVASFGGVSMLLKRYTFGNCLLPFLSPIFPGYMCTIIDVDLVGASCDADVAAAPVAH